jgi:hypothetical protein
MIANNKQIGGQHYAVVKGAQHWDYMITHDVPYLESACSKYLLRWRKKNGLQDLEKAIHFLEKIIESNARWPSRRRPTMPEYAVREMCRLYSCPKEETEMIVHLLNNRSELNFVLNSVENLLAREEISDGSEPGRNYVDQ